jgi:hypothetical protein
VNNTFCMHAFVTFVGTASSSLMAARYVCDIALAELVEIVTGMSDSFEGRRIVPSVHACPLQLTVLLTEKGQHYCNVQQ